MEIEPTGLYMIEMRLKGEQQWYTIRSGIKSEKEAAEAVELMEKSSNKAIYLYREMTHEEINAYKRALRKGKNEDE
jgi:hypothetical protein